MRPYPIGNGNLSPLLPRHFAALMDSLQLRGASTDALLQLERRDWEKLLDFCDLAHLALALGQVVSPDLPSWVLRRLEKNTADNALRYQRALATYVEAAEALRQSGTPHLVLKGFSQAPDYVKHPRLRMQCDLDFYCPKSYIPQAQKSLETLGYTPDSGIDFQRADHTPTLSRKTSWKWNGNMYDPEMPLSIELHFCLWNQHISLVAMCEVEDFWKRREDRKLDQITFPALHPVDQLGYFALHILRGTFWGDWVVHHVHELAVFLTHHANNDGFWTEWERTHSPRLRSLQAIAFWLAEAWFSCDLHKQARMQIDSLPPLHKEWLQQLGGSPLEAMFYRNKDGRLLQFLIADSWATRKTVLQGTIVPPSIVRFLHPSVRTRNRQNLDTVYENRQLAYVLYLADRLASHLRSTARFVAHGMRLWFSQRKLRAQFLLFLSASFFLTSACPHISFSSTYS